MHNDPSFFARKSSGPSLKDFQAGLDLKRLRAYRLQRVRQELTRRDYGACLLYDPINIRYATGTRNMQVWTLHNPARYAFVPAEGPLVLFECEGCEHLSEGVETVGEIRPAVSWFYMMSGSRRPERVQVWAEQIASLMRERCGENRRLAIDRCDPPGAELLQKSGLQIQDGDEVLQQARLIKSRDELAAMNIAMAACDTGIARMREALRPGISECELWSILHQTNIALGGEWIETRLLSSGGRTNPWFQEAGDRVIRPGDLVAFDTDMIGPLGYAADVSRTFFCGPGRPSDRQKTLYRLAAEQISFNLNLIRPGMAFRELSEKAWRPPDEFAQTPYTEIAHGIGLGIEYPMIWHAHDLERFGVDGFLEENMTLCLESYIGAPGDTEGVKLEQQVLITESGCQLMSTFPLEEELMA